MSKPFRGSDPEIWIGTLTVVALLLARTSFPPLTLTWPVDACTTVGTMKIALRSIRGIRNSILGFFVFIAPVFRNMLSGTVNIRVFGVALRAYSHETLEIEKDFHGIPEIYAR